MRRPPHVEYRLCNAQPGLGSSRLPSCCKALDYSTMPGVLRVKKIRINLGNTFEQSDMVRLRVNKVDAFPPVDETGTSRASAYAQLAAAQQGPGSATEPGWTGPCGTIRGPLGVAPISRFSLEMVVAPLLTICVRELPRHPASQGAGRLCRLGQGGRLLEGSGAPTMLRRGLAHAAIRNARGVEHRGPPSAGAVESSSDRGPPRAHS